MGEKVTVEHSEYADPEKGGVSRIDLDDAKYASHIEKNLPVLKALWSYRRACFWSVVASLCIIMEGYDIVLIGSLYAQPAFAKRYGKLYDGEYNIPAKWQLAIGNGGS
ncbi:hypothetical protein TRVA0_049S00122 [Trichomonascus vanleenenianus]|uniref:uncharacterized protein n=1 Tax=Trichomonascus vanleenenianus TaxID=2268995 RepID=UPI003ECB61E6